MRASRLLLSVSLLAGLAFAPVVEQSTATLTDPAGDANGLHQFGLDQSTGPASYGQGDVTGLTVSRDGDTVLLRIDTVDAPDPATQPLNMWYGVRATIDGCQWEFLALSGSAAVDFVPDGESGIVGMLNDLDGCNGRNRFLFGSYLEVSIDKEDPGLTIEVPIGHEFENYDLLVATGQLWTVLSVRTAAGQYSFGGYASSNGSSGGYEEEVTYGLDRTGEIPEFVVPCPADDGECEL
jgi:hypothetical protein